MQVLKFNDALRHGMWLFIICLVALAGCTAGGTSAPTPNPDAPVSSDDPAPGQAVEEDMGEIVEGEAVVSSIQILLMESFPLQATVEVKGDLPDGCTTIGDVATEQNGNTFKVTVKTQRPQDAMCTQALVPFTQNIPLDIVGLKAGTYTVNVNGVEEEFTLDMDNVLPEDNS